METTSYLADITDELVLNVSLRELFLSNAGQMVDMMAGVTGDHISTAVTLKAIPVMAILFYLQSLLVSLYIFMILFLTTIHITQRLK